MNENPNIFRETNNKLKEQKEKELAKYENLVENFEKEKNTMRSSKKFDIFELRQRIETNRSLITLQNDIQEAFKEGIISRNQLSILEDRVRKKEDIIRDPELSHIPLNRTELAKYFSSHKIGENVFIDILGFGYGFFVQGSAILVILFWKIITDCIFLPRDIYNELRK